MHAGGLIDSKPEPRRGSRGLFPGMEGYEFAIQFFEGFNEEIMGSQQKEEVLR